MADTFTKAYSPEEQSTSPVAADYSIITSIGLTASISSTHYSKFMPTRNVQNSGGGVCGGGANEILKSREAHWANLVLGFSKEEHFAFGDILDQTTCQSCTAINRTGWEAREKLLLAKIKI